MNWSIVRASLSGRRFWIVAAPVLAIGSLISATTAWDRSGAARVEPEVRALPVLVQEIESATNAVSTRWYTGTVSAAREAELGFERAARVADVLVEEGSRVSRGQALARLDVRDLELLAAQVRAQRAEAQARLDELEAGPRREVIDAARARVEELSRRRELALLQLERRAKLREREAISKEEYDVAAFEASSLAAAERAARHQLEELEAGSRSEQIRTQQAIVDQLHAKLGSIALDMEKSVLRAPFSGRIGERFVDEGVFVQPGVPVLKIVESAAPEVRIGIPAGVARGLAPGSRRSVSLADREYEATVVSVLPELDPRTRAATALLRLPESAAAVALSGEIGRLRVDQPLDLEGYWLPSEALVRGVRGLWACYALEPAHGSGEDVFRLARRDVEILHSEDDRVLVRGTVVPGDRIVSEGVNRVVPGQLVRPSAR